MESLELMLKGIADNDLKTVQERAHAIRGIALSLQFNEIGALCETLEYSAKQGKEIDYNDVAGQLSEKLTALQKHTDDIIAQLQATEA
jgi:HPt (histidine-containing phosphotransfer) domain-containing protein